MRLIKLSFDVHTRCEISVRLEEMRQGAFCLLNETSGIDLLTAQIHYLNQTSIAE